MRGGNRHDGKRALLLEAAVQAGAGGQDVGGTQQLADEAVPAGDTGRANEDHVLRLQMEVLRQHIGGRVLGRQVEDLGSGTRRLQIFRATDDVDGIGVGGFLLDAAAWLRASIRFRLVIL